MMQRLPFDDPWVVAMLRQYLEPSDLHWSLDLDTAVAIVGHEVAAGNCYFLGNKDDHVLIRVVVRNPYVVEPHVMGNGRKFRNAIRDAVPIGFSLGADRINIYTQYPSISRIVSKFGFKTIAVIPQSHLHCRELVDIEVLTLTKDDYERTRP